MPCGEGAIGATLSVLPSNQRNIAPVANGAALDETNRRLLAELQLDARVSLAELGRRVGLSAPAVAERLQRMELAGIIRAYEARIDPRALGYALAVIIRVRPAPGQLVNVAEAAKERPEIVECHRVTGDDCYLMKAYVRDVEHLEETIDVFAALGQTTTSIVQSSPVAGRGLDLGLDDRDQAQARSTRASV